VIEVGLDVFRTLTLSRHALTNADVVHQFGGARIEVTPESRDVVRVDVGKGSPE
jgi:RNA 3'-terminal phosphate cyclase